MTTEPDRERSFMLFIENMNNILRDNGSDIKIEFDGGRVWFDRHGERISFECLSKDNKEYKRSESQYYAECSNMVESLTSIIIDELYGKEPNN